IATLGAPTAQYAAVERKDVDGMVIDIATALEFEKNGRGRILMRFGDLVKDFHIHVIFATDKAIAMQPQALRGFLKGWFETIAFAVDVLQRDRMIMSGVYDELMPMFSDDGRFDPKALATLAKSYVELQLLPQEPDSKTLYTEAFLPGH